MDVLGGAFTEQDLLSLGYSIEQTLKLRRPPFSTPGLVGGKAPAPKVVTLRPASSGAASMTLTLTYDEPRSELRYNLAVSSADAGRFVAVWIHGGTVEKPGAGRHQLFAAGRPTEGAIVLSASDRTDLAAGGLVVRFYSTASSGGAESVPLVFR